MDMVKIGKFISKLRKEQGLTQEQLGEKLGVTNKTVSRWETGVYLPSVEILIELSQMFSLSINEILSGKRLSEQEYREEAEKNLTMAIRESSFTLQDKIDFFKKKWLKEHIVEMCLCGVLIVAMLIIGVVLHESLIVAASIIALLIAHCWRNNTMMSYVEKNAFNGDSKQNGEH